MWMQIQEVRRTENQRWVHIYLGPVTWSSKKQTTVAISSTEAEYAAAAHACQELIWLRRLLVDMGI
jgi:hypothetical protein